MEEPSNKQGSRMEDSSNKQGSRMEEPSNEQGSRKEDSSNKQDTSTQDKISTAMKVYYEIDNAESNLKMSDDFDGIGIFDPEKFRGDMVEANLQKAASKTHGPVLFKLSGKSVSDKETLKREVKYIKNVRNKKHKRNVCLLLPPIDDDEMIAKLKREIVALGLRRSASFKIYLTLSTPGSVLRINDMIKHGVDGVVISFRELATLITARKPEQISNELLAKDTSVERIISESVKDANGEKIDTVISFGKDNLSDNVLERLVKMGVDAVSVQSEDGSDLKSRIHKIEAERILKHKR
jgi:hypothetical protein